MKIEESLRAEVKANGFAVKVMDIPKSRGTIYKPNGEPMPNMPIDPYHLQRYLRRGFTLLPPSQISAFNTGKKRGRPRKVIKEEIGVSE